MELIVCVDSWYCLTFRYNHLVSLSTVCSIWFIWRTKQLTMQFTRYLFNNTVLWLFRWSDVSCFDTTCGCFCYIAKCCFCFVSSCWETTRNGTKLHCFIFCSQIFYFHTFIKLSVTWKKSDMRLASGRPYFCSVGNPWCLCNASNPTVDFMNH